MKRLYTKIFNAIRDVTTEFPNKKYKQCSVLLPVQFGSRSGLKLSKIQ